jgi:hypothetical protein
MKRMNCQHLPLWFIAKDRGLNKTQRLNISYGNAARTAATRTKTTYVG